MDTLGIHFCDICDLCECSGIVPDTFRIARMILSRLEEEQTGKIIPQDFYCEIPAERQKQQENCAKSLGSRLSRIPKLIEC